jgi:ketosteroid isomerase-like protein
MSSVDIVRAFYGALGRGDVPAAVGLLAPSIKWTEAERFPYIAGTWRTPEAVVDGLLSRLSRNWLDFSTSRPRRKRSLPRASGSWPSATMRGLTG